MNYTDRKDYLIICYSKTYDELQQRFKNRSTYLKLQLFIQVILFSISVGIGVAGIKIETKLEEALYLSIPISLLISFLYIMEDRLISLLVGYLTELSETELKLAELYHPDTKHLKIDNFDSSSHANSLTGFSEYFHTIVMFSSFIILPLFVASGIMRDIRGVFHTSGAIFFLQIFCLLIILFLIYHTTFIRKKIGNSP